MATALEQAIEALLNEAKELAEEINVDSRIVDLKKKITALNTLEELQSQPKTSIGDLLDFGIAAPAASSVSGLSIEPDEFYGKEPLEAAKMYLRKRGKPASLADIVVGVKAGGGNPGPEGALRTSLTRSTYQIAKINEDLFGLVEFYGGGLKRGRSAKKKNGGDGDTDDRTEPEAPAPEAQDAIAWDEDKS
jgi:hypothetical protein